MYGSASSLEAPLPKMLIQQQNDSNNFKHNTIMLCCVVWLMQLETTCLERWSCAGTDHCSISGCIILVIYKLPVAGE